MSNDLGGGGIAILIAILGIWSLVAVVFYIWTLWALSKLFPYLGLPSSHGWIPVWNHWQLLQRAGLPGWIVLLAFVPPLTIATVVVSIMAIHRLNREFGKDLAYTVLGAVLPPIWAMLLASHIADGVYAGASVYSGEAAFPPLAQPARPAAAWPQPVAPGAAPAVPAPGIPGVAPGGPGGGAVPGVPGVPAGSVLAGSVPAGPAPTGSGPAAPGVPDGALQGLPPVPPEALQATPPPAGTSEARDPHAMNDWGFSNTTEGNFERLAAEHLAARPAPPLGVNAPPQPFAWPGEASPAGAGAGLGAGAGAGAVSETPSLVPSPAQAEAAAAYAALPSAGPQPDETPVPPAAQGAGDPLSGDAGVVAPVAVDPALAVPVPAAPVPSVPAPTAPSVPSVPSANPVAGDPLPPVDTQPEAPMPPVAVAPAPPVAAPPVAAAPMPAPPVAASPAPVDTAHPGATSEADLVTAAPVPAATPDPSPAPVPPAFDPLAYRPDAADPDDSGIDDRTVLVRPPARWALDLPDGESLELIGEDIIVGRKPARIDGAEILVINDPTRTVSKSHVRLRFDGEGWTAEDLNSTNGLAVVDETGALTQLVSGLPLPAPERMVLGTLEVTLRRL